MEQPHNEQVNNKKKKNKSTTKKKKEKNEDLDLDTSNMNELFNKLNIMIKSDPDMMSNVSKCVSNIMKDSNIMKEITSVVETNIKNELTKQASSEGSDDDDEPSEEEPVVINKEEPVVVNEE